MSTPTDAVLTVRGASKAFGPRHRRHVALQPLDLDIGPSTRLGIVGESGSGKSTLARLMVGLETPTSGTVASAGEPVSRLLAARESRRAFRKRVQFVAQDTTSSFDPRHTLLRSVSTPAVLLEGLSRDEAEERAMQTFELLELPRRVGDRYPQDVSGGQRQRAALARALVVRPSVLICDEVVSALDVSVQGAVLNLVREYCDDSGAGLVFVSHGLPATAFISEEMLVLYHGEVVEHGATDAVIEDAQHPYTRMLLDAYAGRLSAEQEAGVLA